MASISRKEKQEAAKDAEERFGASSAWHGSKKKDTDEAWHLLVQA